MLFYRVPYYKYTGNIGQTNTNAFLGAPSQDGVFPPGRVYKMLQKNGELGIPWFGSTADASLVCIPEQTTAKTNRKQNVRYDIFSIFYDRFWIMLIFYNISSEYLKYNNLVDLLSISLLVVV